MVAPVAVVLMILLLAGALGCLFSRRARPFALGILGIAALGMLFTRVSVQHSPSPPTIHGSDSATYLTSEHLHQQQQEDARIAAEQADILQNQRMAARMDDAFVQNSPDGSTLETYPDGMQVRQRGSDGFRSIVRSARGDGERWGSSHSTRSEIKFWILGAPLLALIVAFIALKRGKRSGGGGFGAGLAVAGVAAMLLFGYVFTFSGSSRHVTFGTPVPPTQVAEVELAPSRILAESQAEFDRVHQEMLGDLHDVVHQEPIETLWTKLTAPKIKLDLPVDAEAKATQRELANAAKVILSASAPGADPFTQGWLINAAKAIMSATPRAEAPATRSEVVVALPPTAPTKPVTPMKVVTIGTAKEDLFDEEARDRARPDWVDAPPKLVGNTQRVVVSTDPFVSVQECYDQLQDKLRNVVQDRVHELASSAHGRSGVTTPRLESMGVGIEYVLSELCPEDDYVETLNTSVGEMKRAYALVEFNAPQDQFLLDRWHDYARVERIEMVSGLSAFAVAIVGFVYGLLKVDTWTRGYYTKRLFLGVPAAIIAVFFITALFGF